MHVQACQQHCSSCQLNIVQVCQQHCTFMLASSTMFKPVNNTVQAGQLNHVQACQQHCTFKLAMFKPVNRQKQAVRFYVCSRVRFLICRYLGKPFSKCVTD